MPIQEIETKSVNEFWETISPIGNFIERMTSPIFRGQGDSSWSLTPSVLRHDINAKYKNLDGHYNQTDQIVLFEYFLLHDFLHHIDEMGLSVPNDSPEFRKHMEFEQIANRYGMSGLGWPAKEYFSFIALAQHHGIPTRLLDWTKSAHVAAYFAASQVLSLNDVPDRLAVWVLQPSVLKMLEGKLEYVFLPGSTSNNLAAQKGVFLIHRQQFDMSRNSSFLPDREKNAVDLLFQENANCLIQKVTLPASLAGDLIFRCSKFGISAATLFPGFDGAAKAALEFKLAKKMAGIL